MGSPATSLCAGEERRRGLYTVFSFVFIFVPRIVPIDRRSGIVLGQVIVFPGRCG